MSAGRVSAGATIEAAINVNHDDDHLGEYRLLRRLAPDGSTLLVRDAHGHRLTLKPLPADCLLAGQLHPSIRQRLARVRELPDLRIATLRGVERIEGRAYLVWEYVEGESLEDRAADVTPRLLQDVAQAVESIHSHGLVHGAIHARNVILTPDRGIRITHVSPLLYDDPRQDHAATGAMLDSLNRRRSRPAPAQSAPAQTAPDHAAPDHAAPDHAAPDQTAPAQALREPSDEPASDIQSPFKSPRLNLHLLATALLLTAIVLSGALAWWATHPASSQPPPPLRAGSLVSGSPST